MARLDLDHRKSGRVGRRACRVLDDPAPRSSDARFDLVGFVLANHRAATFGDRIGGDSKLDLPREARSPSVWCVAVHDREQVIEVEKVPARIVDLKPVLPGEAVEPHEVARHRPRVGPDIPAGDHSVELAMRLRFVGVVVDLSIT